MDAEQPIEPLTAREREILACLAQRLSNQEIADRLYLSLKTVKWYNTQIYQKLGVKNRAEALRKLATAAPAGPAIPRTSLPAQANPLIGRETELRDLAQLLDNPHVRLVTLLAPGGMGKTHLAIEAAARCAACFTDGACFVALARVGSPDDLVTAIGGAAGVRFHGAGAAKQQLLDFLRGQALLLVLDNFEHLAAGAPLIAEMIAAAPGVKVLITSRERLHLSGERVYTLDGVAVPAPDTDLLTCDSVRLFLFHAQRVRRNFAAGEPSSLARIAQLTQGMPLALVLAAAWADVLSPAQIAEEIAHGLDVLQRDMPDLPARHRNMHAVFDPTWDRLSQAQRDVFIRLSILRGGFTREAAQAVAGADFRMLSALAGKALIQPQPDGRYAIHELLRQYAESHLEASGAADSTHAAHAAYFLDYLAQREADVKGRRQVAALNEINDDFENIRQAWLWAMENKRHDAIDHALECLVIAGEITGRLLETQSLLRQSAEQLAGHAQRLWERVVVRLGHLDNALRSDGDLERLEAVLRRARASGVALEVAWCLWVLAEREAIIHGRDRQSQPLLEELITLCRATGNDYLLAHGLTGISWRYANHGQVERAVESLRECLIIRRQIGDVKNLDYATAQLIWLTFDLLQDAEPAESLLDEQISTLQETGTVSILPLLLGIKAAMAFWRHEPDSAQMLALEGLKLARHLNYLGGRSMCLGALGVLESHRGRYQEAQRLCQEGITMGFSNLTTFLSHWGGALAGYGLGDEMGSRRSLSAALEIACRYKSPTFQGMSLLLVSMTGWAERHPSRAVEYLAFCDGQPPHLTGWMRHWPLLAERRAYLQSQLGAEAYAVAWLQGQTLDLNREAANTLAELQAQPYSTGLN